MNYRIRNGEKLDLNKLAASGLATALNEQMFSLYRRLGESKDLIAFFLQYKWTYQTYAWREKGVHLIDLLELPKGQRGFKKAKHTLHCELPLFLPSYLLLSKHSRALTSFTTLHTHTAGPGKRSHGLVHGPKS